MAKFTSIQIADAISNRIEEATPLRNASSHHPYWGIQDSRGWLSRFPDDKAALISRDWMWQFIASGGTLDAAGVWGICPYDVYLEQWSPVQVAGWLAAAHNRRWDNVPNLQQIQRWVDVSNTATLTHLKQMSQGAEFLDYCAEWGYYPLKQGKSIFWAFRMSQKFAYPCNSNASWLDWICARATKVGASKYPHQVSGEVTHPLAKHLVASWNKGRARKNRYYAANRNLKRLQPWTRNYRVWSTPYTQTVARHLLLLGGNFSTTYNVQTTAGTIRVSQYHGGELLAFNGKEITPRTVAGVKIVKIADTVFAWKDSFRDHAEGRNVKEAVDVLTGRVGIHSTSISFAMVRKAKGYCLPGTRQWLLANMPFLGTLLQPYRNWDEVPSDIMNHVWEFASRSWLKGRLD